MDYIRKMKIARGEELAELVLKNCRIINVYSGEIEDADIAIEGEMILGVGSYSGKIEHNLKHAYVAPGFIDGHVHIESSMLTPPGFAKMIIPKGTTTIIADPHEIANVSGNKGIQFMLDASEKIPLNVLIMIPSCVPATIEENSGAVITAEDIQTFLLHPKVLGLGEVMDYPAVIRGDYLMHEKIELMRKRVIDGHAPDILGFDLNAYIASGVMTDHESTVEISLTERIKRGMYVHLREGSATRNVKALLKGITKENIHRTLFCTDDKHPFDIESEGHINYNVNLAIDFGIDPVDAIRMATLNAANCYNLPHLGGIAPNKQADLIVFDNLKKIEPKLVFYKGQLVAKDGKALFDLHVDIPKEITNTVQFDDSILNFDLKLKSNKVHVIGLVQGNITTKDCIREVKVENGLFIYDDQIDIIKLAVIERHKNRKKIGLGLVEGFQIKNGALAMTIAHDSHNLLILGTNDQDMTLAAKKIKEIQGGIVLVRNGKVEDFLQLEVAGIMTANSEVLVQETLLRMKDKIKEMGLAKEVDDPFISLAFLALPVIPDLKLTDRGLFDVNQYKIIPIEIE
ncbi:MAG: adenine deaminase [Acholeplasmataceae bacterium]|nr:adenine deaminase [Acholeplasmataceae bacterium]